MRFKVEELNYSIIKFTIWNFPKVKLSCPYIKYIWDNIASHLYNLFSSNFQPHVTLFHICLWFRAFLSNYAKNLYSVHSVLFSFIQSTFVLFSPIWSYSIHFSLIQCYSIHFGLLWFYSIHYVHFGPIHSYSIHFGPIESTFVLSS